MADVYSIAMELNLDDKASEGLRGITDSLGKLATELSKVTEGFTALNGAIIAGAGVGIALGLTRMMEAANKFTDSLARMKITGIDTMQALDAATRTSRQVPSFTRERGLEELRMLTRFMSPSQAAAFLPQAARTEEQFALFGAPGGLEPVMRMAMLRNLTIPGRERELAAFVESQLRTVQATQGAVTPERLQSALARGGIAGMQMDPEMLNVVLPMMIQSGIGGRMGPVQAMALLEQGALSSIQGRGAAGGQVNRRAMAAFLGRQMGTEDVNLLGRNPYQWAQGVYKELQKRGMGPEDEEGLYQMLERIFKNPRTAALMAAFMMQGTAALGAQSPFARFAAQREAAGGTTERAMAELEKLPSHNIEVLQARVEDLFTTLASKDTTLFNTWLISMRDWVISVDDWVHKTPAATIETITKALMGLSAALITLGTAGVLAAFLPGGWITLAILGIATAVGILGGLEWTKAESALENLYNAINRWLHKVVQADQPEGEWGRIGNRPVFRGRAGPVAPDAEGHWDRIGGRPVFRGPPEPGPPATTQNNPASAPFFGEFRTGTQPKNDVNVALSLNLDGQTFGSALWQSILTFQQFPSGAAAGNSAAGWSVDQPMKQ